MIEALRYYAPTAGYGGYEVHSREMLRQLVRRGIQVHHRSMTFHTSSVMKDKEMQTVLLRSMTTDVPMFTPFVCVCVPDTAFHLVDYRLWGRVPKFNITTFEADRIPNTWVFCSDAMDGTILTNRFLKDVWVNSGADERKIRVVGEGVNPDFFHRNVKPLPLKWRNDPIDGFRYRFLMVSEFSLRKNINQAVRCFVRAFKGRDDVCLVIKASYLDKKRDALSYLKGINLREANVFVHDQIIPDLQMPGFMAGFTHYYSLSHGEGWDLNCPNMGALGKVIVAPNIMAYRDYLNNARAFLIDQSEWIPAKQDSGLQHIFEGSRWCGYKDDHVIDVLRESVRSDSVCQQKADTFNRYVREMLTWERQVGLLLDALNDLADANSISDDTVSPEDYRP